RPRRPRRDRPQAPPLPGAGRPGRRGDRCHPDARPTPGSLPLAKSRGFAPRRLVCSAPVWRVVALTCRGPRFDLPRRAGLQVSPMSEVTRLLSAIDSGDPGAAQQLLPLVYDELRRLAAAQMAREKPGQTLDATGLVHEAWMRLSGGQDFESRSHFFRAAA